MEGEGDEGGCREEGNQNVKTTGDTFNKKTFIYLFEKHRKGAQMQG